ncbi:hypothetical protein MNBD_GAMMA19-372 [hydrothermal vent metagenome]|uniref:Uncharacterized protein n=1 Tax=hydrothermal vent metagenome TaxID=652676 RepID=A0A3B0ZJX5_9ZZZZ
MNLRNNDGIDRQFKCELRAKLLCFRRMQQSLGFGSVTCDPGTACFAECKPMILFV